MVLWQMLVAYQGSNKGDYPLIIHEPVKKMPSFVAILTHQRG
jgi:hypothetical protein